MIEEKLRELRSRAESNDFKGTGDMFADDVVLHSPTGPETVEGREIAILCVQTAIDLLHTGTFRVLDTIGFGQRGVMEFESEIHGQVINGADFIRLNDEGKIAEFKVMVRPKEVANQFCDEMTTRVAKNLKDR